MRLCLGRDRSFRAGVAIGKGSANAVIRAERKGRIPSDAVGNVRHRIGILLRALADKRRHVRAGTADGAGRIAVRNTGGIGNTYHAAHLGIASAVDGSRCVAVRQVSILDETAETAAMGVLRSHGAAGDSAVRDIVILHPHKTTAVGAAGNGGAFHTALIGGNAIVAVEACAHLADETADIGRRISNEGGILHNAPPERNAGLRIATETAALGLAAVVVRDRSALVDAIRETGIFRRSDETAGVLDTGHVTRRPAIVKGRCTRRIAGETTRIFRAIVHVRRRSAIRKRGSHF